MRRWVAILGCVIALPLSATAAEYENVDAATVLAEPEAWNGRRVAIAGELVGDYSPRPEGTWVQINDDQFAGTPVAQGASPGSFNVGLGALLPAGTDLADQPPGRYDRRGPVVRLEGTFRHSDPQFQGETYLEVDRLTVLQPSSHIPDTGPDSWLIVGIALLAVAALLRLSSKREL